jgi:hypothetical protein
MRMASARVPTRPCPVPRCTREWAVHRYRFEHLVMMGEKGKPLKARLLVNWCGHSQQVIPWPEKDGYWTLVPIVRETSA